MICVLDSSAAIAYLAREPGREIVEQHLDAGECLIHAVNTCEVMDHFRRLRTAQEVEELLFQLETAGIVTRGDFDLPFLRLVANYKVAPGPTALGDCFGLALAQHLDLPFVTVDRHEMTRVSERGTVAIEFIR